MTANLRKIYIDEGEDDQVAVTKYFAKNATKNDLLIPLQKVVSELSDKFATWQIPWADINRYQRVSSDINQQDNDQLPSVPVPFASAFWGMLPSYNSRYYPGTKKRYGVSGNSFVCAVEFGKK